MKKILKDTSFISTVYNEEDSIQDFLESLKSQTVLPGEIIIVDGGSKDRTFSRMEDFFDKWVREE
jgi:glycosyltransferase involved in cell wall biosynthesis